MNFIVTGLVSALAILSTSANSAEYFVDQKSSSASDSGNGSASAPWKSLYAVNGRSFSPGDVITVRDGTYSMSTGGNWDRPIVNLGSSGTQTSPITIRAEHQYGAVLDGGGASANAPLGSSGKNWIIIDGFDIRNTGPKGVAIFDATGVVVQNCKIRGVKWNTTPGDNTDGIRVERSDKTVLRNNDISGIDSGQANHWNGAGIKLYDTSNTIAENNYIHDYAGSGIFDKRGGNNNTYRFNRISNVYDALVLNTVSGYTAQNIRFHNNIVTNVANLSQTDERIDGAVYVYSNTFVNYSAMGLRVRSSNSAHRYYSYNNIFVRASTLAGNMGDEVVVNPTMLARSNYNVFPSKGAQFVLYQYLSNELSLSSLTSWQSATKGADGQSELANVGFVNASGGDYRLVSGSPLKGTARVDGVDSGQPIDPGAYSKGNEVIGLSKASAQPASPVLSVIQ